jgi:RNA-directed DNA polymerase
VLVRGTKAQACAIKQAISDFLRQELGLELSEEKTKLTHINEGFDFLGYHIFRNPKPRNRRRVGLFVIPAKANLERVRQKIREMTSRKALNDDYLNKLTALNAVIRGWANYYRAVNPMATFKKLDRFVWHRLLHWLQRKYGVGTYEVYRTYQAHQNGPLGGTNEYASLDESTGKLVWRYRATQTKLKYYRPVSKKNWPHPYLEKAKTRGENERFELPALAKAWTGIREAPLYEAVRRRVLGRAGGKCERCGQATKLVVHHKHRVGRKAGQPKLRGADNRVQMLEAVCQACHNGEHWAESSRRAKNRAREQKQKVI